MTINYYDDYTFPGLPSNFTPPTGNSSMTKGLLTAAQTNVLGSTDMLWTVHYYDDNARVIQSYQQHYLGGTTGNSTVNGRLVVGNYDVVSNTYDFTGEVTGTTRKHFNTTSASPIVTIANSYNYDHIGRKLQTFEQINGGTNVLLSKTDYNEVGQVMGKHLHSEDNGSTFLQNVGYLYNERGWMLSSLTNQNGTPTNLFNLYLRYNNNIQNTATLQQFNGNIAEMQYAGQGAGKTFDYTYDQLNRLLIAASGGTLDETITYDNMGNINSLLRTGGANAANLGYNYTDANSNLTNQLYSVQNNGGNYRTYGYDPNGNATSDGGINGAAKAISYNLLNLPQSVTQYNNTIATYTYDAGGSKLRDTGGDGSWDYIDGIVYNAPPGGANAISFIQTEEGRVTYNNGVYKYQYDLKDHLGNTRVIFDKGPGGATEVVQENEYYAFGLVNRVSDNGSNNRYLYNGKEIQRDLINQYDYGARFYDPVIARWTTPDPLAEFMRRWTPYNYAFNNPIRFVDPTGMAGKDTTLNGGMLKEVVITAKKESSSVWGSIGNFIIDNAPFVGSGKQIYEGIRDGDWKKATLGTVFLAVDVFTAGEGGEGLKLAEEGAEELIKIAAEDEVKEGAEKSLEEGIVYERTDPKTGEKYVGQSKSDERYLERQKEHDRDLGVKHDYKELGRAEPGKKLDHLEETHIRQGGGPKNKGGSLANKRYQVNDAKYRAAGGSVGKPTR